MAEIQTIPNKFTTVKYKAKDGENCTATKKDGIVTVVGDKHGVRQIPLDDFMKEFVENLPKVDLVKTPAKDTVQFSGAENPADKTKIPENPPVSEEDKSVAINKKNLAIGGALTLIAAAGLYVFGRGRWWSKAAENAGKKGQELADEVTNMIKYGIKTGEEKPIEKSADEIVQGAEELTGKKPEIKVESHEVQEPVIQTESPKVEQPKQPEKTPIQKPSNLDGAELNNLRVNSPIPESEMFVIPKDLETDVEKIIQNGRCDNTPLIIDGKQVYGYTLETPEGFSRVYYITDDNVIMGMNEFAKNNIIPFRIFNFEHGQVRSITDNTKPIIDKKFFHVEPPKTEVPKVEEPKVELPKGEEPKVSEPKIQPVKPKKLAGADIPRTGMFEIPTDIELNAEKILEFGAKGGKFCVVNSFDHKLVTLNLPNGVARYYNINSKNEVTFIRETIKGEIRDIKFKNGKPVSITSGKVTIELTPKEQALIMGKNKSAKTPKNKPAKNQPVKKEEPVAEQKNAEGTAKQKEQQEAMDRISQQQQEEFLKQEQELARRQQESIDRTNEDIINAAVIADIATQGTRKGVKPVTEGLNTDKIAKDIKGAADELFGNHPEKAADELFGYNPEKSVDELFAPETGRTGEDLFAHNPSRQTQGVVDDLEPGYNFETPRIGDETDGLFHTDDFNSLTRDYDIPGTTVDDVMPHVDEPDIFSDFGGGEGMFG